MRDFAMNFFNYRQGYPLRQFGKSCLQHHGLGQSHLIACAARQENPANLGCQ